MTAPSRRPASAAPSAVTASSLLLGFAGTLASANGHWAFGAWAIVWCVFLDILDGRLARWLGAESTLGAQLDSLADMVAFGVAPAMLVFQVAAAPSPTWLAVAAFGISCGALVLVVAYRLARFNTRKPTTGFIGLPAPMAALLVAGLVLSGYDPASPSSILSALLALAALALAALMVSRIPFVHLDGGGRPLLRRLFALCLILVLAAAALRRFPEVVLICALIYLVAGINRTNRREAAD